MASLTFNEVALSDYGLTVLRADEDRLEREVRSTRLQERVHSWRSKFVPKRLTLQVYVTATSAQNIYDLLSQCRGALNQNTECKLVLSEVPDRYWWAIFRLMTGNLLSSKQWRGDIEFVLSDPRAFSDTETVSNHNIDADPKTLTEAVGGTGFVEPVYLLTAGENLVAITLTFESLTTGEALVWTGSLDSGEKLEIDVVNWIIKKEGIVDMGNVSGEFPTLQAGANSLKITGFLSSGTLSITYRDTYV